LQRRQRSLWRLALARRRGLFPVKLCGRAALLAQSGGVARDRHRGHSRRVSAGTWVSQLVRLITAAQGCRAPARPAACVRPASCSTAAFVRPPQSWRAAPRPRAPGAARDGRAAAVEHPTLPDTARAARAAAVGHDRHQQQPRHPQAVVRQLGVSRPGQPARRCARARTAPRPAIALSLTQPPARPTRLTVRARAQQARLAAAPAGQHACLCAAFRSPGQQPRTLRPRASRRVLMNWRMRHAHMA